MSTRCNIKVVPQKRNNPKGAELWFYRHSDGYPESVLPSLKPLIEALRSGKLRDNLSQFSGWLVVAGHREYRKEDWMGNVGYDWKVGAYEPTTGMHGDIEYLYTIDLNTKSVDFEDLRGQSELSPEQWLENYELTPVQEEG